MDVFNTENYYSVVIHRNDYLYQLLIFVITLITNSFVYIYIYRLQIILYFPLYYNITYIYAYATTK